MDVTAVDTPRYTHTSDSPGMTASLPQPPDRTYNDHLFNTGLSIAFQLPVPEIKKIISLRYGNEHFGNGDELEAEYGSAMSNRHPWAEETFSLRNTSEAEAASARVKNAKVAIFEAWKGRAARATATTSSAEKTVTSVARVVDTNESGAGDTLAGSSAAAAARVAEFRAMLSGTIPTGASVSGRGNVSEENADARARRAQITDARSATARSRAAKNSNSRASRAQPSQAKATKSRVVNTTATNARGLRPGAVTDTLPRAASISTLLANGVEAIACRGASLSGGALNPISIDEDSPGNMMLDVPALITGNYDTENLDPELFANPPPLHKASDINDTSSEALQIGYYPTDSSVSQAGNIIQVSSVNAENGRIQFDGHKQSEQSQEQFDLESLFEEKSSDEEAIHSLLCEMDRSPSLGQSNLDSLFEEEETSEKANFNDLSPPEVTQAHPAQEKTITAQPQASYAPHTLSCGSSNPTVVPDIRPQSVPSTDEFHLGPSYEPELFSLATFNYADVGSHTADPTTVTTNEDLNSLHELGLFTPAELNYAAFGALPANPSSSFTIQNYNGPRTKLPH